MKKITLLNINTFIAHVIFMLSISFASFAGEMAPEAIDGTIKVSADDIFELYEKFDNLVIIDSRKPADRVAGYIEDSIALPDFDTNADSLTQYIETKSTPVVFYCNGKKCGRSVKAAKIAVKEGYTNVYWFRGGWAEWTGKKYPFVKD